MKLHILFIHILFMTLLSTVLTFVILQQSKELENKFLKHHIALSQDLSEKDCWICTHSPVSAQSMPYLAIPVPLQEMLEWEHCSDTLASNHTQYSRNWNTSVEIPIVGWVAPPWWQGNLSCSSWSTHQRLMFKGGTWVTRSVTKILNLGRVPDQGIKVSFDRTSESTDTFKPSQLERHLHDPGWDFNYLFPEGSINTCPKVKGHQECNESTSYNPGDPTCNNPDVGYCGVLGQIPGWCYMTNVSTLIDLAQRLVNQHSAQWELPHDIYWICGGGAYKWLPVGINGTCTLARLTPATFIIRNEDIDIRSVPKHLLYKRVADNNERKNGRPHVVQMGVTNKVFSTIFLYPMVMQMWDKLVEATDYLDDQIFTILDMTNTSVSVQNQLIIVTKQHTIDLDYLTAAQGGMCQIIGPGCCHFIDPEGTIQIRRRLEDVKKLRDMYDRENDLHKDSWWGDTFAFMNPVNWFKGLGGWLSGLLHTVLQVFLMLLLLYCLVKLLLCCCSRIGKTRISAPK